MANLLGAVYFIQLVAKTFAVVGNSPWLRQCLQGYPCRSHVYGFTFERVWFATWILTKHNSFVNRTSYAATLSHSSWQWNMNYTYVAWNGHTLVWYSIHTSFKKMQRFLKLHYNELQGNISINYRVGLQPTAYMLRCH